VLSATRRPGARHRLRDRWARRALADAGSTPSAMGLRPPRDRHRRPRVGVDLPWAPTASSSSSRRTWSTSTRPSCRGVAERLGSCQGRDPAPDPVLRVRPARPSTPTCARRRRTGGCASWPVKPGVEIVRPSRSREAPDRRPLRGAARDRASSPGRRVADAPTPLELVALLRLVAHVDDVATSGR
jgi:hypothetical protein